MGKRCAIVRCMTGRKNLDKRITIRKKTLFRVPKDDHAFDKWKQVVPSPGVQLSRSSSICEDHFREADIIRESSITCKDGLIYKAPVEPPVLKKEAIPCFFMNEKESSPKIPSSSPSLEQPLSNPGLTNQSGNLPDIEFCDVAKWDFKRLSASYRNIELPSSEWAVAANERYKFIQFISIQDKDVQRGLRIYADLHIEVLLDNYTVNVRNLHPPKCEADLVQLLDTINKLKVCKTVTGKNRSQRARRYRFE